MSEKTQAQIDAEKQLSQIMSNTGVQVDFSSGAPTFSADYTTLENVDQNQIVSLLGTINPVTQTTEGGGFTPMQYGGTTYQTETDWNQFVTSQQQEGFQFNAETNDFAFNRTFGDETYTDPNEWRTFANKRAMQGYDWNKEQQDFSFVNFGVRTFDRKLEDGTFETITDVINSPEKFEEYKAFRASQGFVVQVDRTPIRDAAGNITGYQPIETRTEVIGKDKDGKDITREVPVRGTTGLTEVNAMKWHSENSPNFTRFPGVNGADATVFNGTVYRLNTPADQEAFRRTVAAYTATLDTTKAKEITDAMYFMLDGGQPGVVKSDEPDLKTEFKAINYTDETFGQLSFATPEALQTYIDQKRTEGYMVTVNEDGTLRHVPMADTSSVDPANLKSILAGLGAAAPGFMYTWDEQAEAEVARTYGVATAEAVRNAVQARVDLSSMRAEALNTFYGGKYASASKIEKFGWSGGAVSDERMRMAYINASINSQMMTQKELIQAGYDSELAIAREYAQLNLMKLSEEKYQMAVTNAENFAKLTGYWISPETKDVMSNYFAAESLPESDPRRQAIMKGVDLYLKAQGIDEGTWIQAQEFFRSVMSFNQTIEREMSEAAKLAADRDYNLRALIGGVDPVTGERVTPATTPTTTGDTTPTALPPVYTSEDGSEFTRYPIDGTSDYIYFDEQGNAYEAIVDDKGNITMELREEGARKIVPSDNGPIEYFLDENGVYRDIDGYDISQHPREGNTRDIDGKTHTYTNGQWVLHSMYSKSEERWNAVQVYQKTGTEKISIDSATPPRGINNFEWTLIKEGYFEFGDLIKFPRNSVFQEDKYFYFYDGNLIEMDKAIMENNSEYLKPTPIRGGEIFSWLSEKSTTVVDASKITNAALIGPYKGAPGEKGLVEEMGRNILSLALSGKLPDNTLFQFTDPNVLMHYKDGQFRKLDIKDVPTISPSQLNISGFDDMYVFDFTNHPQGIGNYFKTQDDIKDLIAGKTIEETTDDKSNVVTIDLQDRSVNDTSQVFLQAGERSGSGDTFWFNGAQYNTSAEANAAKEEFDKTTPTITTESTTSNTITNRFQPSSKDVNDGDIWVEESTGISRFVVSNPNDESSKYFLTETEKQIWDTLNINELSEGALTSIKNHLGRANYLDKQHLLETIQKYDKEFVPFYSGNTKVGTINDYISKRMGMGNATNKNNLEQELIFAFEAGQYIKNNAGEFVSFTAENNLGRVVPVNSLDEYLNMRRLINSGTASKENKDRRTQELDNQFKNVNQKRTGTAAKTFSQISQPSIAQSRNNDIWNNTATGQRFIFNTGRWLLVPPSNARTIVRPVDEQSDLIASAIQGNTPTPRTPVTGGGGGDVGTGSGTTMANVLASQ